MPDLTMEYLAELLKEKRQLACYGNTFTHVERLIDQEISRVRAAIFQTHFKKEDLELPEPEGDVTVMQERVYIPIKDYPEYNFVGRILGPRGMTAKQLELDTECKIMIRGQGSLRDRKKEEMMRGKPTWEHLDDDLHVLIQVEDTPNRAKVKLENAVKQIKKLLVPTSEGMDELKKKQLMELAIINGTYRSASKDPYKSFRESTLPPWADDSPVRASSVPAPYMMPTSPTAMGHPPLVPYSPLTPANQSPFSFSYMPPSPPNYELSSGLSQLMSQFNKFNRLSLDSPLSTSLVRSDFSSPLCSAQTSPLQGSYGTNQPPLPTFSPMYDGPIRRPLPEFGRQNNP